MKVETYEIEEMKSSEASTMAADSEAIELCTKLGLEGQLKLANPETATRFPYPELTAEQSCIIEALFPQHVALSEYSRGIVPLRVLQVAAFCRDFPQTGYLEVWHARTPNEDPILIGRKGSYDNPRYLLARWGDALPTWEELRKKAEVVVRTKIQAEIEKARVTANGLSARLPEFLQESFDRGSITSLYFNP